ncbi:MAG: hypothetical protein JXR50_06345 [Prolixibacteraceae bacterium]|nr:hypothetical protein [Prolixibacteraceae bacterium]
MSTEVTQLELAYPEIKLRNGHKREYKQLIDNFFAEYNNDKPGRKQLKAPHKQVLQELIFYAHIIIERDAKLLREEGLTDGVTPSSWIRVNMNRFILSRELHRSPDTVKRYKRRLAEAGAILTSQEDFDRVGINRGSRKHVLINPDLLLIYDRFNPEYQPTSPYLSETEIRAIREKKGANCIGVTGTVTLPDQGNNEIMPVETVQKRRSAEAEHKTGSYRITTLPDHPPKLNAGPDHQKSCAKKGRKIAKNSSSEPQNPIIEARPGENSPEIEEKTPQASKKQDKLAELRRSFAIELYALLVHFLFRNHSIYAGEAKKAIAYIENVYAANLVNEEQAREWMKGYKWRVEKAAEFISRNNYDFSNVYPLHYLNVNNPKGFTATKAWLSKHREDLIRKARMQTINRQKLLEQQILKEAIGKYREFPTMQIFRQQMAIVQDKIPHLYNDFMNQVWESINGPQQQC